VNFYLLFSLKNNLYKEVLLYYNMAITNLNSVEEFNKEVKESNGVVLVDLWAPWCGPCKMLGPIYEAVSNDYEDVKFTKINIDEVEGIDSEFNVMSIPTILIFKDGKLVDQKMGAMPKGQLKEIVESQL
jgi:thioredoxin 1